MIGLDTNVLVRYVAHDDEPAFQVANSLIQSSLAGGEPVLISTVVLLECEWVLRSRFGLSKDQRIALFTGLLSARDVLFDDEAVVELALRSWRDSSADFGDCLIVGLYVKAGCQSVATFDKKAATLPGAVLLRA